MMKKFNLIHGISLALLLLLTGIAFVAKGQSSFDITGYIKSNTAISSLQFSPDGQKLLYTLSRVDWENNGRKSEIVLLDIASKAQEVLNFKERNVTQLAWSPSGKYMSYLAISDTTGTPLAQLFIREKQGEKGTCITASKSGITSYSWSPSEDKMAYIAPDVLEKKDGTDKYIQAFEVGNNSYLTTKATLPSHLYLVDLKAKNTAAKRMTNGSWTVKEVKWLNNTSIIFTQGETPYSGDMLKNKSLVYDLNSGEMKKIIPDITSETNLIPSPDKNTIAFYHDKDEIPANIFELSLFSLKDKKVFRLTENLDKTITGYKWMFDGNSLVASIVNGAKNDLVTIGLDKKVVTLPIQDISSIAEFAINKKGQIAILGSTPGSFTEIYLLNLSTNDLQKMTSYNSFLEKFSLGKTEYLEWPSSDGLTADGIVTYPPNFDKNKKYPLVLYIHGGPTASSNSSFSAFVQHLAANGWVILQPNYRGSNNRGNRFQNAISNDAGKGPGEDIVNGVEALKKKGFIDEKKIAVTGWSYGGYMTAWLIGKYPTMWKVAVAGAAPVDITDMSSLTDLNVMTRHAMTSSPWQGDNYKKYYEMSPISNLSKARTPTLIMSVVGDVRVSVTGSYKIYHALKANEVPVQFIAYPGSAHFPADPINSNDVYQRWTGWLKKYLN